MKVKLNILLLLFISSISVLAQSDPILGVWEADGGYASEYKMGLNNTFEGYLMAFPKSFEHYGFSKGEKVKVLRRVGINEYEGEEKTRFSGEDRVEWRPVRYIIQDNRLKKVSTSGRVLSVSKSRNSRETSACPNFLGIGKLAGMLEMGAVNNYDNNWMISTIDYALSHVRASGCLSDTYLIGLRSRVLSTKENWKLAKEIHNYSLSLDTEVLTCF